MKASFYTESILFSLAKGISFLAQRLPAEWNVRLGAAVGTGLYHLLPSRRAVALGNIKAAFGAAVGLEESRRILKKLFRNLGMTFMEIARIPAIDRPYADRWITVAPGSRQRLEAALAQGRGVLFLTGHFGNWELISIFGALRGYPSLVLAREQGWPRLNRMLTRYRESRGCKVVTKGFPVRELIRGLREGKVVGVLADQDGGRRGMLAPFFGRLASTAPGIFALALKTQAPVLPVFMIRGRGPAHTLTIGEPIVLPESGSETERIRTGIARYLAVMERMIRAHPDQWLWLHRRWKSSPQKRLLLLDDGRAGHRAQTRAFAERLERAWEARLRDDKRLEGGPSDFSAFRRVEVREVPVRYRHPLRRVLLSAAVSCGFASCGRFAWLRWALTPESYRALAGSHADVSVSCGSAAAPVNLLWARGIRARAVQITRSRFPSWRRFDLAVIPRHDIGDGSAGWMAGGFAPKTVPSRSRRKSASLLLTDGALAPRAGADEPFFREAARRLNLTRSRRIGLLIGGPAKGVRLTEAQIEAAVRSLLAACDRADAELLVSTSRRTPLALERRLERLLEGDPRCKLLAFVNRNRAEGFRDTAEALRYILGAAGVLAVSGDSISMVSEGLEAGRPVVGFHPEPVGRRGAVSKYRRFLEGLEKRGKIRVAGPDRLGEAAVALLDGRRVPERPGEDPVVEYLKRWL